MIEQSYFVYITTNQHHTTLYTGVTNDLIRRIEEHKKGIGSAFSKRYNLTKLVYYEVYPDIRSAINQEKQLKAGSRAKKIALIDSLNPSWSDLLEDVLG